MHGKENVWSYQDKTGKNNPFFGKKHSEETKKRISETKKGTIAWNKGKKLNSEEKEKLKQRKFNLICKQCNNKFIGTTGSQKYCPSCKELLNKKTNN